MRRGNDLKDHDAGRENRTATRGSKRSVAECSIGKELQVPIPISQHCLNAKYLVRISDLVDCTRVRESVPTPARLSFLGMEITSLSK